MSDERPTQIEHTVLELRRRSRGCKQDIEVLAHVRGHKIPAVDLEFTEHNIAVRIVYIKDDKGMIIRIVVIYPEGPCRNERSVSGGIFSVRAVRKEDVCRLCNTCLPFRRLERVARLMPALWRRRGV